MHPRLCLHTITTKPWPIETAIDAYARAGVGGISVWRDALEGRSAADTGRRIREAGLKIVSYVRGGFFPAREVSARQQAVDDNRRILDEAATLGAPHVVLVCGAAVGQSLETSRRQIAEGIAALLPHARACGVRLAIEPLHPMYADTRSAVVTMAQANTLAEELQDDHVGVALDVYHVWWDDQLPAQIARCGAGGRLFAFHICDWRTPTRDLLNDRGIMGEGCIPIRQIWSDVDAAGFTGFAEVEIFSTEYWAMDQQVFLARIVRAYETLVGQDAGS